MWKMLCIAPFLFSWVCSTSEAKGKYKIIGDCDGIPAIDVATPPGVCVGLVAEGFKFPRGVAGLPNGSVLVVDMGGWARKKGSLWVLKRSSSKKEFEKKKVLENLDEPHDVKVGNDGNIYVGEVSRLIRIPKSLIVPKEGTEVILDDLPVTGRHPLRAFVFDRKGNLFVNFGSVTDNCEKGKGIPPDPNEPCSEAEGTDPRGSIRKFIPKGNGQYDQPNGSVLARGLRNSMALAVHPKSDLLLQGENSRDYIHRIDPKLDDVELPHEELNVIGEGGHYGWPYCFDNGKPSPEYPSTECSKYKPPTVMLPAHVAPLGMLYYSGAMFPDWYQGKLLVTYHGYRDYGHRVVVIDVDEKGIPKASTPGGLAVSYDLISDWNKKDNQPMGAPVGISIGADGSLFLAEDKNGTILRVFFDPKKGSGIPKESVFKVAQKDSAESPQEVAARCGQLEKRNDLFSQVQRKIIDTSCISCHGNPTQYAGNLLLKKCDDVGNARRILAKREKREALATACNPKSEFVLRLQGNTPGLPLMPPIGALSDQDISLARQWIQNGAPIPGLESPKACP